MILIHSGKYHVGTTNEQRIKLAKRYGCHPTWLNDDLPAQDVELRAFGLIAIQLPIYNTLLSLIPPDIKNQHGGGRVLSRNMLIIRLLVFLVKMSRLMLNGLAKDCQQQRNGK